MTETIPHFKFGEGHAVDLTEDMTESAFAQCTYIRCFPKSDLSSVLEKIKLCNIYVKNFEFGKTCVPDRYKLAELGNSVSNLYHHYRLHFNKRISGIVESSLQISQGEICNSDGGGSVVVMIYWKLTSSGAEISSFLAYEK